MLTRWYFGYQLIKLSGRIKTWNILMLPLNLWGLYPIVFEYEILKDFEFSEKFMKNFRTQTLIVCQDKDYSQIHKIIIVRRFDLFKMRTSYDRIWSFSATEGLLRMISHQQTSSSFPFTYFLSRGYRFDLSLSKHSLPWNQL